ncbi:MAG TPA: hypothetical protein VFA31_01225 [Candidatus Polarisedimenticolia bacterium]|nr:hypothetical protein [Candidatus Polarisedimenticolia bacterium]
MLRWAMDLGHVSDPIQRDLDVRRVRRGDGRATVFARALGRPEGTARAAGEWVALAERVEDLSSYASRRVGAERGAAIAAIAMGGLHQTDDAPGDEVFPIRAAAPGIDGSRSDRSRELKVRDDAVISSRESRFGQDAPPLRRGPYARLPSVSIAN